MTYFIATIKAHGFKLYDFAEEIGLTGAALSNRLHGRTDWTLPEAQRACKVLGMTRTHSRDTSRWTKNVYRPNNLTAKGRPTVTQNRSGKSFSSSTKMARRAVCTTWENLCFSYIGPGGRFHPFFCAVFCTIWGTAPDPENLRKPVFFPI